MAEKKWTTVIEPRRKLFDMHLGELWKYKDLIFLFVKRNFTTRYKQTILGPIWFFVQPLITTLLNTFVFGSLAGLGGGLGVPSFLFFMAGNLAWTFFAGSVSIGQGALAGNAGLFSKVYFPRLVSPIASLITQFIDFLLKIALYVVFILYFVIFEGANIVPTWELALIPIVLIQMALLGVGVGFIFSSLTVKYRDLTIIITFIMQAWMYITPVVYSRADILSTFGENWLTIFMINPVTPMVEMFRYATLGAGTFSWMYWGISWAFTAVIFLIGLILFNKTEKNFIDTI